MIYTTVILGVLGLVFGSFVNALVWRLKHKRNWVNDRSECVHCHHKLSALDLVPVLSWLALRGKCRYCKKKISSQYPIVELVVALLFAGSYFFWPVQLNHLAPWYNFVDFGFWLIFIIFLMTLFLYDLRWYVLPDKLTYPLIALGLMDGILRIIWVQHALDASALLNLLYGILPIGALYAFLFFISKGTWVGLGDAKLGVFIGLVLGWQGAALVLFLANFLGVLVILPGLLSKKLSRTSRIPFGPFLIVSFFVTGIFGVRLIDWYMTHFLLLN